LLFIPFLLNPFSVSFVFSFFFFFNLHKNSSGNWCFFIWREHPRNRRGRYSPEKKEERRLENFSLFLSFVTHKTRFAVRAHLFITRKNGDVQRIYRATELLDQEKRVYGTLFYSGSNKSQLFVSSTQSIFCLR